MSYILKVSLMGGFVVLLTSNILLGKIPDYLPLNPGAYWNYQNSSGNLLEMAVSGQRQICGLDATILASSWQIESQEGEDQHFWSKDNEGNVYYHGWESLAPQPEIVVFNPPWTYLDLPLYIGKTWDISGTMYSDFFCSPPGEFFSYSAMVIDFQEVTVPAGTFPAVKVEISFGGGRVETRWFSDGVGWVHHDPEGIFVPWELYEWNAGTASEALTWGRVKSLYR